MTQTSHCMTESEAYTTQHRSSFRPFYVYILIFYFSTHGKSKALERSKKVPLQVARHGLMLSGMHCAASPLWKEQQASREAAANA